VNVRPYEHGDLEGVFALHVAEGWPSFPSDPVRAHRILTNPGVTSFVAVDDGRVVGFTYMLSDGEIQAFLANIVVAADARKQGVGRQLIAAALRKAGGERIDLLSSADEFYAHLPHHRWAGFRIYPPFTP
jgi:GNAT superfamily N-acetyltransferase